MRIVVITVGHQRFDVRIWHKEIKALAASGLGITYEVADGEGNATVDGIEITDRYISPSSRHVILRLLRLCRITANAALHTAAKRGDVVHFHDALFLPGAILLALAGRRVVYDVHEDYPKQVRNIHFPAIVRHFASVGFWLAERFGSLLFSGIIAATPAIAKNFPSSKTAMVRNYPRLAELGDISLDGYDRRPNAFVYVGQIAEIRGAREMVAGISRVSGTSRLNMAGQFINRTCEKSLRSLPGWDRVSFSGWESRQGIKNLLGSARAGLVLFHPTQNHLEALPVKLFEYMCAGLPVIASDFPLWREIVGASQCGLLVNPLDVRAITSAMEWLLDHPDKAREMGRRGHQAIRKQYSWEHESKTLLRFYQNRLGVSSHSNPGDKSATIRFNN